MAAEAPRESSRSRYCPLCEAVYESGDTCPVDGATLVIEAQADPLLGSVIGDAYQIESFIGSGGMGRVYRGTQLSLDRPVAIKVMRLERSADPAMVRRFLREVRLSSRLDHPNIVRVIDGGNTREGRCYLIMELLEGVTLGDYVPEGGLRWEEVRELFGQLCSGVQAFHRAGLVHRDLKPNNVLLVDDGDGGRRVKIFDFGLARDLDPDTTGLTAEGEFLGTPGYVAPEQMSSGEVTLQTDVYALGAVLYFMLTKRSAFPGKTGPAVVMNQLAGNSAELRIGAQGVPRGLDAVMARALELDIEDRFDSVEALIEALIGVDQDMPRRERSGLGPWLDTGKIAATRGGASKQRAPLSRRAVLMGLGGLGAAIGMGVGVAIQLRSKPIRLGMSGALSGPAGGVGRGVAEGLEVRFAQANEAGELGRGRPIELEVLDDGYESERARANVERFAKDKLAVVGCVGTRTTAASLELVNAAGLPMIGSHSGARHLRHDPPDRYVFNYRAGYGREAQALVQHFRRREKIPPTGFAVLAQDDSYGESGLDGIRRALAADGFHDFDAIQVARYPSNTMDVHAALEAVSARSQVQVVLLVAAYRAAAQFVADLSRLDDAPRCAGISPIAGKLFVDELRALGGNPEGMLITQVVPHPESSANGVLRYREALAAHRPGATPSFVSLEGYIVGDMVVEALRRSGRSDDREALVEALESFDAVDFGFGARLSFSASDHQGSERVWATRIDAAGRLLDFELS
ncbi:Serine/threonine protein kinase [Plesiocystis pacifica SIR-1]|uniref:Serine/threonine protein kinase n=1 Tax=Plesiocystis pacifica SIR-1 TaxID=391625 RepID=A6FXR0_9BACT|nr:Serine/threonine protein kinase [Plesiocystis pacifica SIR-1]